MTVFLGPPIIQAPGHWRAKSESCSPGVLSGRDILGSPKNGRGRLECVRHCTRDIDCELAVYQEFLAGSATCTKMSAVLPGSLNTLDVSDSKLCTAANVNPCLNQGILYQGICLCPDGFTGQACEYANPSFCHTKWVAITKWVTAENTLYVDRSRIDSFYRATPKLVFRNRALQVDSVMSAMNVDRTGEYWYLLTFMFLEKTSWNRFADKPRRQFIHMMNDGNYELLSLNATSRSYSQSDYQVDFSFVAPGELRFTVQRQMPNDWELMADDLSDGYELEDYTWANVDKKKKVVVAHLADRLMTVYAGGHFIIPPEMRNLKYVLGVQTARADSQMHSGKVKDLSSGSIQRKSYLNPCWTTVSGGKYSKASLLTDWKMLGTYLRLGNDVRINIGTTYHQVLEVIQIGDDFTFLLAPFLSQNDTASFTATLHGVRSLVTSSAVYESCTHQIEGETVIAWDTRHTSEQVVWFLDSRRWKKVFAVFSNTSVAGGSVSDLISGVLAGSDVRIWIEWLESGFSRFFKTHMSSVTDDRKVSTESLVTWRTNIGADVTLSSTCDLQYILVTSEGRAEIMSFNILTPGRSEVQNDVMITWFLA